MLGKPERYAGLLWLDVEQDIGWVVLGQIFEVSWMITVMLLIMD